MGNKLFPYVTNEKFVDVEDGQFTIVYMIVAKTNFTMLGKEVSRYRTALALSA